MTPGKSAEFLGLSRRRFGAYGRGQALVHDLAGQVEDGRVVVQGVVGVRGQHDAVELKGQPAGILAGRQLAPVHGDGGEAAQQVTELSLAPGDQLPDRPRPGGHPQGRAGHEAAARDGPPFQVREERLAHRDQLRLAGRGRLGGLDDLLGEDPRRLFHRGQLKLQLGAEVPGHVALVHTQGRRQPWDGQLVHPVHRRHRGRRPQDGAAGRLGAGAAQRSGFAHDLGNVARARSGVACCRWLHRAGFSVLVSAESLTRRCG